ncbi:MAG: TetR/AcrR family transcriptional regulator [Bacteroidota bacterium]
MDLPKKPKSYFAILASAKTLFWKHGIKRITVEEICKKAGVSKMTYYRLFNNKNDVAEKVLEDIMEDGMMKYRKIMDQQIPYPEKMKQMLVLKKESSSEISEEFIRDIYEDGESGLLQKMSAYAVNANEIVKEDYRIAQSEGWIRKDLKLDFIMYMSDSLTAMLLDKNLLSMYDSPQEAIMEITNFFFYGILSAENRTT